MLLNELFDNALDYDAQEYANGGASYAFKAPNGKWSEVLFGRDTQDVRDDIIFNYAVEHMPEELGNYLEDHLEEYYDSITKLQGVPRPIEFIFDVGGKTSITGEGGANAIFATVLKIFREYVGKNAIDMMTFSAKEESRIKLYRRMVRMLKQYKIFEFPDPQTQGAIHFVVINDKIKSRLDEITQQLAGSIKMAMGGGGTAMTVASDNNHESDEDFFADIDRRSAN